MGFDSSEPEQRSRLRSALSAAQISTGDLWLYYFGIGGSVGEYEVEAYLQGLLSLPELQRDLLAMAANELFSGQPGHRAPYSDEFGADDPPADPAGPEDTA
ncbi:hypothetical protein [Arthrobacter sp. 754]|uniref:hypothetical protein n=1 Tax=Arthrobacter sp. 754 TaxID=3156315 RepID=UPI003393DE12